MVCNICVVFIVNILDLGTVTWYCVGWSHNWVHFHFLDLAAKYKDDVVPPQSVLGILLNAHLRYTSSINNAGPGDSFFNPQSKRHGCLSKYAIWKVQPMPGIQFRYKVAQNTTSYYLETDEISGNKKQIKFDKFPPMWVRQRMPDDKINFKKHIRGVIPSLDMLADYYIVIKRFVDNLWLNEVDISNHRQTLLEKDMFYQFLRQLETHGLPGIYVCIIPFVWILPVRPD